MGVKRLAKKIFIELGIIKEPRLPDGRYRLHGTAEAKNSTLGNYTYVSTGTLIQSADIGKFCSIGPNTVIGYGNHPVNFISSSPMFYHTKKIFGKTFAKEEAFETFERVTIGNDVWIGANVYIKNGVSVGDGCIIAAGAVVVKDLPPYSVAGGVPAKLIRKRFTDDIIEGLLKICWWNWSDELLKEKQRYFITSNTDQIRDFINQCNET